MKCDDFMPFLDAYVDQELDEQDVREAEVHLASCHACREAVSYQIAFKERLKESLLTSMPSGLEGRVWDFISKSGTDEAVEVIDLPAVSKRRRIAAYGWIAAPLAAALAAVLLLPALTISPASSASTPVIEQTLDWHRGSFPIEVTGPDADQVVGWFGDKVDFPVRLPDFGSRATILGARIAHVQDRRAAYVVYEVDGTRLSVMMFNGEGLTVPVDHVRRVNQRDMVLVNQDGYEVAVVQDGGVTYTVAGELAEDRFLALVTESFKP